MSAHRFALGLALAALLATAHSLALAALADRHRSSDSGRYLMIADGIQSGRYGTRLGDAAVVEPRLEDVFQREAYRTPGYPAFVGAFGGGLRDSDTPLLIAQALLLGMTTVFLGLAARRLASDNVALAAAFLFALDPFTKRYAALVMAEALAALIVAVFLLALVAAVSEPRRRWWAAVGAAAGAAALVRPQLVLLAGAAAAAAFLGPVRRSAQAANATIVVAAACAFLIPWLAWTTSVVGRPVLASGGPGAVLLIAAHGDDATSTDAELVADFRRMLRGAPSAGEYLASANTLARWEQVVDRRAAARARERYRERLSAEPLTVVREWLGRALLLWTAHEDLMQPQVTGFKDLVLDVGEGMTLALFAMGAVVLVLRPGLPRWLVLALLAFTLITAVGHTEPRFSIPFRSVELLVVTVALAEIWAVGRRVWLRRSPLALAR